MRAIGILGQLGTYCDILHMQALQLACFNLGLCQFKMF